MKNMQKKLNNLKFVRLFFICLVIILVAGILIYIINKTGLIQKINSVDKIREIVEKGGIFSELIYMFLQILQTTILQIPAIFTTLAGVFTFGTWKTFVLTYISIMIGSTIMFLLGRKIGRKFLYWIVGETKGEMWIEKLKHGKYLYFLMMLFPLFPDDLLCAVAGITDMKFSFFFWTNIITRGIGIACTVYFGSGVIIPFYGWGLVVWAIIGVSIITLFYLSVKFQDKIDTFFKRINKDKNI